MRLDNAKKSTNGGQLTDQLPKLHDPAMTSTLEPMTGHNHNLETMQIGIGNTAKM